ncbi:TonB-dependent receptor domain-containing protein [Sphingomonas sp.]|uniref:TonB-dependent receptor domain-containing protein n=1 Tax=Sphingomonas sp. TaxID=28214 RepID=UPI00286DB942|nr:TonB-dependent receptor [Sphingomonas sp.]
MQAIATDIIVTAARTPEEAAATAASATVLDAERIARLGEPLVPALLRLTPSAAIATSGPAGSLTEVRIRGAEANHTLLFIDGIRVNDPAAGNTARFELLNADLASRIEVVRGPQSALWGSEAIGGVIAIDGEDRQGWAAASEAGSFGFRRASASGGIRSDSAALSLGLGWQRARGIDSFNGEGDRDGYRNLSGRLRGTWQVSPGIELGAAGLALTGKSQFDGLDALTGARRDTLDTNRNRLLAGRLWSRFGAQDSAWSGDLSIALLGSSNRNIVAGDEINRTRGQRLTFAGQLEHRFAFAGAAHTLVAALDREDEDFRARDQIYFGATNQDQSRRHDAVTVEWRAEAGPLVGDVALRHDRFNRFKDATSLRASLLGELGGGWSLAASYGEGIAQPTFFDLFGFFPGSFLGNPSLQPESSRGVEAALRYRKGELHGALTWYRQRLTDEIIDTFDAPSGRFTTANRPGKSRRSGVEAELGYAFKPFRLTAYYAYLDASEPGDVRETRRPKHSGSVALDGAGGRLTYGASLAYTGARTDRDFDFFPAPTVRLGAYWLASGRLAYALTERAELFARVANAFDERYQEVFGYRTEGRSAHVGIRLAARR